MALTPPLLYHSKVAVVERPAAVPAEEGGRAQVGRMQLHILPLRKAGGHGRPVEPDRVEVLARPTPDAHEHVPLRGMDRGLLPALPAQEERTSAPAGPQRPPFIGREGETRDVAAVLDLDRRHVLALLQVQHLPAPLRRRRGALAPMGPNRARVGVLGGDAGRVK